MLDDRRRCDPSRLVSIHDRERRRSRHGDGDCCELERCGCAAEEPAEELEDPCGRAALRPWLRAGLLELLRDCAPRAEEQRLDSRDGNAELARDLVVRGTL